MLGTLLSASQGESMTESYSIFFGQHNTNFACKRAGMGADQLHHMLSDFERFIMVARAQWFAGQVKLQAY